MKATLSMPKGMDTLLEVLGQMGEDVDAAAARALEAGAEVAVQGIKSRARVLTGAMRDAAGASEVISDGLGVYIEVGWIKPDAETARKVNAHEFGTSSMEAQPMVRPTLEEDKKAIMAAMFNSLQDEGFA